MARMIRAMITSGGAPIRMAGVRRLLACALGEYRMVVTAGLNGDMGFPGDGAVCAAVTSRNEPAKATRLDFMH